jgi:hypothetical protein
MTTMAEQVRRSTPVPAVDREAFWRDGYVHLDRVVPQHLCDDAVAAIWDFLGMDPDDPGSWHRPPMAPIGLVEFYQHQALWDVRQHPAVHAAFAAVLDEPRLWVNVNRVSVKPPPHPDHPDYDLPPFLHWDTDTSDPATIRFGLQGLVYLVDVDPDMGPFHCIPEIYRDLPGWAATQPADRNPFVPDTTGHTPVRMPGRAGDLIIFSNRLPHGADAMRGARTRLVQYISMEAAREDDVDLRAQRIIDWYERRSPKTDVTFWGDPRRQEEKHGTTAQLTPLGRRLLGLDRWEP